MLRRTFIRRVAIFLGLVFCVSLNAKALADYTITTQEPMPQPYYMNPSYYYASPQVASGQSYYPVQYPNQYNPYWNRPRYPYGYGYNPYNNVNTGTVTDNVKTQIIRNVGQNILYSMMNHY